VHFYHIRQKLGKVILDIFIQSPIFPYECRRKPFKDFSNLHSIEKLFALDPNVVNSFIPTEINILDDLLNKFFVF